MADSIFITLSPWAKNIQGEVYGDLTVEGPVRTNKNGVIWLCRCACGAATYASTRSLRKGNVRSCGCLAKRLSVARATTHGMSRSQEYRAWRGMNERCHKADHPAFKHYGARGIAVCPRWRESFVAFVSDMGLAPDRAHSLDRIDNDRGYEPSNCRWATALEQANNRRNTVTVFYLGEHKTLTAWMRDLGLPGRHSLYLNRIRSGWDVHAAFTTPSRKLTPDQIDKNQKENRAL